MTQFTKSIFLVVESNGLTNAGDIAAMLRKNGAAQVLIKKDNDNTIHYLDGNHTPQITHIITTSIQFIEYKQAIKSMIPITTPEWVYDSVNNQKIPSPKLYNPDPKFFLKDCYVCVADNLPAGDKEIIYGGIKAFGGNYLDVLTKFTTHLIALDLSNEKSIIASSAIDENTSERIDIKIVLPHWIDHCMMLGKKIDETPYLLPNPSILKVSIPNSQINLIETLPAIAKKTTFFENKSFYISPDYKLSERLNKSIIALIEQQGGRVEDEFDTTYVDIYIGKERNGANFLEAVKDSRIITGNLPWLYHVIVNREWILPINSSLLHYPFPIYKPLKGKYISITNYSGDARIYLARIIELLGGNFTKTLTKENDYLIAAKSQGKKYDTAVSKWLDENNKPLIQVLNHLWLEDCYANGELVDPEKPKYTFLGKNNDGVEFLIGKTKLNEAKLISPAVNTSFDEVKSDGVDRNDYDDETPVKQASPVRQTREPLAGKKSISKEHEFINGEVGDKGFSDAELVGVNPTDISISGSKPGDKRDLQSVEKSKIISESEKADSAKNSQSRKDKILQDQDQNVETTKKNPKLNKKLSPSPTPPVQRLGRSAALMAASKLHSNMEDLNQYQESIKSATKMKTYLNEVIEGLLPAKRATSEASSTPSKKQKASSPPVKYVYTGVMTGCEQQVELSDSDKSNFASVGLKILSEYSSKVKINTLIAPKVLRTEKFLSSLSKVERVIHPNYIIDLRDKLNDADDKKLAFESININDYSLEKVLSLSEVNFELGVTDSKSNGLQDMLKKIDANVGLFSGMSLNLSTNLNGGVAIISKILKIHGLDDFKEIKLATGLQKSLMKSEKDNVVILIAHKSKDKKLVDSFRKLYKDLSNEGVVVEWDWCVKSIFQMNLQEFNEYRLT